MAYGISDVEGAGGAGRFLGGTKIEAISGKIAVTGCHVAQAPGMAPRIWRPRTDLK